MIQAQENKEHESLIREKKAEVEALRNEIRSLTAQISELNNAILKIELAGRLHCSTNDLETKVVECPVDKLGEVIGKGGSKLKELQQQTGCVVEVNRNDSKVILKGNTSAIQHAVKKIEDIILILDDEILLTSKIHSFLFSNVSIMPQILIGLFFIFYNPAFSPQKSIFQLLSIIGYGAFQGTTK